MMSEPTIQGLTTRQKIIADLLWQCESESSLTLLIKSLPSKQDQIDAASLVRIMTYEVMESEGLLDRWQDATNDILVDIASR
jgi:hypothetical protein